MSKLTATSWGAAQSVRFAGKGAGIGATVGGPLYSKPEAAATASKRAIGASASGLAQNSSNPQVVSVASGPA
jgi:hypothetical protein